MGLTKKFRSKKTDQESQSPVIKVFKDMMHRSDNANNPEKLKLIKSKHEKKIKRYTRSKVKSDEKSDDTSATCPERNYKVQSNQQPPQSFSKVRSAVFPAASCPTAPVQEKNSKLKSDSKTSSKIKCMWGGESGVKLSASKDDTCSCMTCALKKLTKPQRNRLLGIGAIVLITLIVAMYCILKPAPPKKPRDLMNSYEILARTLQPETADKRDRRSQYDLDGKGAGERQDWDESKSKLLSGLSDLYGADFNDGSSHEGSLHEANPVESPGSSSLTDLSNVLDPNKISEGYSSNSLRNFYKKLIQTDMQIKNLKKSIRDIKSLNDYTDYNMPRSKRSLTTTKVTKEAGGVGWDYRDFNLFFPPASAMTIQPNVNKVKREFNYSNPTGIVIEKHKLVLQYQPKTKVAKCSHTPKDPKTKAHESDHKHPFYKNSERLDAILDRLLADPKMLHESMFDKINDMHTTTLRTPSAPLPKAHPKSCEPKNIDLALLVKKVKHPHGHDYILSTENIFELKRQKPQASCVSMPVTSGISSSAKPQTTTATVTSRLRFFQEYDPRQHGDDNISFGTELMQQQLQKVKQQFNGVLSVSTLINGNKMPEEKKVDAQRIPGHRKLLQVALEEELKEKPEVEQIPGHRKLLQVDLEEEPEEEVELQRMKGNRRPLQHLEMPVEKVEVQRMPGLRRLLQVDLEEDRWGDPAGDDVKRTRRMGQLQPPKQTKKNYYPIDTHNPNWKDTMPLYPDELNAIIKQAAIQNYNRVIPMNRDNTVTKDMSDTEYVEDYSNNKYDKLVKMAQAYSDYGVLDDKKGMRNDKDGKGLENRVKLAARNGLGFFGRLKKSNKTEKHFQIPEELPVLIEREGIRFEFKPNPRAETTTHETTAKTDNDHVEPANEVFQFGKHVKIADNSPKNPVGQQPLQTHTPILKSFDFMTPSFKSQSSSKPIKQTRFSERGLFFFGPHRRSLKSVEAEDEDENDGTTETYDLNSITDIPNTTQEAVIPFIDEEFKTESEYSTVTTSSYTGGRTDNQIETTAYKIPMGNVASENIADFNNSMISEIKHHSSNLSSVVFEEFNEDWIMSFTGSDSNGNITNDTRMLHIEEELKPATILLIQLPPLPIFSPDDVRYGKRKLMSVEETQNNVTSASDGDKEIEKSTEVSLATDIAAQVTTAKLNEIGNASNIEENTVANDVANIDNKTIVKRSAPDSNLIFWNDIYDEEYGVKDPLDDHMRDKHFHLNNDIISKPGSWIGGKLRKIADRVRKTASNRQPVTVRNKVNKRSDKLFEESSDKVDFAALTANMKKVCREAAKVVHETKSSEVRSRGEAASTLMQQLVGLMSDLVEIQVQQKTCVKLPPELQKFLAWLTAPDPEEREYNQPSPPQNQETTSEAYSPEGLPTEIFREISSSSPDLLPTSTDVRTECLGTIHDVQRLITLYDGMSEEDKSKMSGVREYLENQLDFLHKQLSNFEGFYDPSAFHRIRRRITPKNKGLRRMKRKIHRFIKNFGKKRTRSTVTYDAFETYTDSYNSKNDGRNDINAIKDDKIKDEPKGGKGNNNVKRNLPDVYYRALAESRNSTTVKSLSTNSTYKS